MRMGTEMHISDAAIPADLPAKAPVPSAQSLLASSAVPAKAPVPSSQRRARPMAALTALRAHWPEYLIEGWALGMFMVSAGLVATLFGSAGSPLPHALRDPTLSRVLGGIAMGLTAMALIYSPWGQRSGAHMNPAVTLTFLRLRKVKPWDAVFYIVAQFIGGAIGVFLVIALVRDAFAAPPVSYAVTVPGTGGTSVAFAAELAISGFLIFVILAAANSARYARYAGVFAGVLVATYIGLESPLSGMSMNPARTFASALPGGIWSAFWIYLTAPVIGMQLGASLYAVVIGRRVPGCAKLIHGKRQRCIHCGYEPARVALPEA
jgi:aquaporin Z